MEKSGNSDQLNIAVATEPSTSAQESIPNAEVVADKHDQVNIDIELDTKTFFERRGSVFDETMYNLLKRHFKPNKNYPFPVHVTGSKTRKFQVSWMDKYTWLVFSSLKKGFFRKYCALFACNQARRGFHQTLGQLVIEPHVNSKNTMEDFSKHQTNSYYKDTVGWGESFLVTMIRQVS